MPHNPSLSDFDRKPPIDFFGPHPTPKRTSYDSLWKAQVFWLVNLNQIDSYRILVLYMPFYTWFTWAWGREREIHLLRKEWFSLPCHTQVQFPAQIKVNEKSWHMTVRKEPFKRELQRQEGKMMTGVFCGTAKLGHLPMKYNPGHKNLSNIWRLMLQKNNPVKSLSCFSW